MRAPLLAALLALVVVVGLVPATASAADADTVTITVLSNRADLVAGGDALVEVTVPADAAVVDLQVDVDGRDVTDAFVERDGRALGLVVGLAIGRNELTAALSDGRGATLTITNHPHAGPVISGPHIEPWTCSEGAEDEDCNRAPTYEWHYMPTSGTGFRSYDPENPPGDVAETTTDGGETVPYIVREEIGVIARDQYRIAVLFDPDADWTPTEPQEAWNRKVVITHGQSCDTSYEMGEAPDVLNDTALGRGFAVVSHALDHAGHNCNILTQAESLLMTKEYLVDTYGGPIRYTIGTGCSGGSLTQQQVANAYPGIYQGILPQCSYPDAWSSAMQYVDYDLLRRYFEDPSQWGTPWAPNQMSAVFGHPNITNPITFTEVIPNSGNPSRSCPGVPDEDVYDAESNPEGVRCTLQDYMVNIFGRRPPAAWGEVEQQLGHGFANRPWDNVGVQYGLDALLSGELLPAQFVDLNTKIGSGDYDYVPQRQRTEGRAIDILYRSGANNTASNLDQVAIIDLRGPDPGAFHDVYRTYAMRDRIIREHGHADNQILWRGTVPLIGDANFVSQGIVAMDSWLATVEADERDVPIAQKLVEDRPEDVTHRCTDGATGSDVPAEYCDAVVESYSTPRMAAGMPSTDDVQKCQLVPLEAFDYGDVTFTGDEWALLEETFPTGVCDYSEPGVGFQPTVPWLDYSDGPGGEPLNEPPASVPLGVAAGGSVAATGGPLPATGGGLATAALGVLAVSGLLAARRRR